MKRLAAITIVAAITHGAFAADAPAQVRYVYPPGVQVGPSGIQIRTPFWSGFFPAPPGRPPLPPIPFPFRRRRVIIAPAPTPPTVVSPAPAQPAPPQEPKFVAPAPKLVPKATPKKTPAQKERPLTIEEFAKSFQPKAGNYKVTLLNPINGAATNVRFTLPEGTPKNVHVGKNSVEFRYGLRRYVRIEFDQEGAIVISR